MYNNVNIYSKNTKTIYTEKKKISNEENIHRRNTGLYIKTRYECFILKIR